MYDASYVLRCVAVLVALRWKGFSVCFVFRRFVYDASYVLRSAALFVALRLKGFFNLEAGTLCLLYVALQQGLF